MRLGALRRAVVVVACLAAASFVGCSKTETTEDSESHFLTKCTGDCGGGLVCLCGVCTQPCDDADRCAALSEGAVCTNACDPDGALVCDVGCTGDDECSSLGADFTCRAGRCRQSAGPAEGPASSCQREPDPTPTVPAPTELDPDLVARAGLVIGSCFPDDGVARNTAHIWEAHLGTAVDYRRYGAQLDCLANAACGCEGAKSCTGLTLESTAEACAPSCEGDVVTGCEGTIKYVRDCSRLGLTCDPVGNCFGEPPTACDDAAPPTCTAEGEIEYCTDGSLRHSPCQSLGFSCVDGVCVGDGPDCDYSGSKEEVTWLAIGCAGSTLTACVGSHEASIDCATQGPGFSCRTVGDQIFCGLASDCFPGTATACDGNVLSFCNVGRLERYDCTELGFTGCGTGSLGRAACVPGALDEFR